MTSHLLTLYGLNEHSENKSVSIAVLFITGLLLTACTTLDIAALQPNKRYAVVSFYYDANILPALGHYGRPVE